MLRFCLAATRKSRRTSLWWSDKTVEERSSIRTQNPLNSPSNNVPLTFRLMKLFIFICHLPFYLHFLGQTVLLSSPLLWYPITPAATFPPATNCKRMTLCPWKNTHVPLTTLCQILVSGTCSFQWERKFGIDGIDWKQRLSEERQKDRETERQTET